MSAKITAALHAIMSEVSYVQKTGKNAFHGYSYAGEADLLGVLRPAMLKHGLMLLPSVENVSPVDEHGNVTVLMSYSLVHKDGDVWPTPLNAAGMGNDRAKNGSVGDKGVYKAITGANKYLLFKLFQIETGNDPDAVSQHDETSSGPLPVRPSNSPAEAVPVPAKSGLKDTAQRALWGRLVAATRAVKTLAEFNALWAHPASQAAYDGFSKDWKDEMDAEKRDKEAELRERAPADDPTVTLDRQFPGDIPLTHEQKIAATP